MRSKSALGLAVSLATAIAILAGTANAATVTWGSVETITGGSNIQSAGVTDLAGANFGRTTGTTTIVNNGSVDIEFKSLNSGQNVTLSNGVNVAAASAWGNWGNNGGISGVGGTFETVLDWNLGIEDGNPLSAAITLSGLTNGTQYQIQFFADSTGNNSQTISGSDPMNSLTGKFVTGTFTADATSQVLTVAYTDNNFAVANALTIGVMSTVASLDLYWDLNDTEAGAGGGSAPAGVWNAGNAYWNPKADGTGSAAAWTGGKRAVFAAGSNATDPYMVDVDGTRDIGGLRFEEGAVTIVTTTAGQFRLVDDGDAEVAAGLTATIQTAITEDATPRSLTKKGDGTLVLSPGAVAYSGGTAVRAGTLQLGGNDVFDGNSVTVAGNAAGVTATLDLNDHDDTVSSLTLGGAGATSGAAVITGGTLTLGGNVAYDSTNNPLGATISGKLDLGLATRTFTVNDSATAADDLTISADISGTGGGLTKAGAGTLVLSGNNTYDGVTTVSAGMVVLSGDNNAATGGTTINAGVVQFDSPASINGTARDVTVNAGGMVVFGSAFGDADIPAALSDRIVASSAGVIAADNHATADFDFGTAGLNTFLGAFGSVTYTGTLTPGNNVYRLGGGGTLTMGTALTGDRDLVIAGPGTVNLSATNTFTGDVTVNGGTLNIDAAGDLNGIARTVTVNSAGTLNLAVADGVNNTDMAVDGTANVTAANAVNGATVSVNTGGTLAATNATGTPMGFANAFTGSTIVLNGGTLKFNASPLGNTASITTTVVGGNILVNADSTLNNYDSRQGRYLNLIQFGKLDFAAADPVAKPNGYKLENSSLGQKINYQPSKIWTAFVGSTISNNGWLYLNKSTSAENYEDYTYLDTTAIRAGKKLTITENVGGDQLIGAELKNSLGVAMLGGAELLGAPSFTMLDASDLTATHFTDNSTFDTTSGLWSRSGTTTITATLANGAGSLAVGGSSLSFAAEDAAYVSLTGLTIDATYKLYLELDNSGDLATVLAQLAKNPAFTSISGTGSEVRFNFTAPAETAYFAWDNVHETAADWYLGGDLTYVGWSASAIPGDTNGDKVVDAADFITLKKNFGAGEGGGAAVGNFDNSGDVDWADLAFLMTNMSAGLGGTASAAPEPATLFVMMAAGLPALLKRRRRRS